MATCFRGSRDGPSQLLELPEEQIWDIDDSHNIAEALAALAAEVGASKIHPGVNCRGVFCMPARPPVPAGKLTASAMCAIVAALQPEDCVVVDESLTSGPSYWDHAKVRGEGYMNEDRRLLRIRRTGHAAYTNNPCPGSNPRPRARPSVQPAKQYKAE